MSLSWPSEVHNSTVSIFIFTSSMYMYHNLPKIHPFNSEVSTPKKQHLMMFMRALLTTIIGQCRVKTSNTELAVACLYKAVIRFMTSQNAPKCAQLIVNDIHSHNPIHGSLKRVTTQVGLEKGLGLQSTSATQAIPCRFRPSHGPLIKQTRVVTNC